MVQYTFSRQTDELQAQGLSASYVKDVRWSSEKQNAVELIHVCGYCGKEQMIRGLIGAEGAWYCRCHNGLSVKIPNLDSLGETKETW